MPPLFNSVSSIEKLALSHENVNKFVADKEIRKIIIVPKKLVNIVVGD